MIPIGGIALWSGALLDVPAGWQLCDGTNGTPDLRGKFVKGAGPADAVDGQGGTVDHTHLALDLGHRHTENGTVNVAGSGPSTAWNGTAFSSIDPTDIVIGTTDNIPPFYNLAYIQRLL